MGGIDTNEALCAQLAPEVAEKYFYANYYGERFQLRTGQIVCQACPIQLDCLADAIATPGDHYGVRGGETANSIRRLHTTYNQMDVPAQELARRAIAQHRHRDLIGNLRTAAFAPNLPALPSGPAAVPVPRSA